MKTNAVPGASRARGEETRGAARRADHTLSTVLFSFDCTGKFSRETARTKRPHRRAKTFYASPLWANQPRLSRKLSKRPSDREAANTRTRRNERGETPDRIYFLKLI